MCIDFSFFKTFKNLFIWLCWVFVAVYGLSLIVARGGYSLVAEHGLLVVVASLIVKHR